MSFIGKDGYKYADNSTFFKIHNNELIHKKYISIFFIIRKIQILLYGKKIRTEYLNKCHAILCCKDMNST